MEIERMAPLGSVADDINNGRDVVVVYSNRMNPERGTHSPQVGVAHYSLHLSAKRFLGALELLDIRARFVARPEIFATDVSRSFIAPSSAHIVHIAVGDFESLRLLKGAYNIAYVAWEYEAISTTTIEGDPVWKNQLWVLARFDEVWVGCEFVRDVLQKAGLQNVFVIPAPIPNSTGYAKRSPKIEKVIGNLQAVPLWLDFSMSQEYNEAMLRKMTCPAFELIGQHAVDSRPRIYLTIINPGDGRKNAEATVLAFARFAQRYPGNLLIVKLVSAPGGPVGEKIFRTFRHRINRLLGDGHIASRSILFVDGFLDEEKLMDLVQSVDFYISNSFAEGLNLPVLEAMSRGTVVISPIHTAMADYLSEENCIECSSNPVLVDSHPETGYRAGMVTRNVASIEDVYLALEKSQTLSASELETKRSKAAEVAELYTMSAVSKKIAGRLEHATYVLQGA